MITVSDGERLVQDQELAGMVLNQKSTQMFSVDTIIDFTPNCRTAVKTSKNNKLFLVIYDALKNGSEARIPIGMLLRSPFLSDNCAPMKGQTSLQDALLACLNDKNPGLSAWNLVKGRKIKVVRNVSCKDRPFGVTEDQDVLFNIFDWV